jgi:trehalose/maltose transport system substrate-binding protein
MRIRVPWLLACAFIAALATRPAQAAELTLACDAFGRGAQACQESAQAWAKKNGHTIKLIRVPTSSSERLNLYQQLLAAQSPLIDIFMIDIVWPGILANSFVDLSKPAAATIKDHFPAIVKANTVDGRLVGMPWFTDAGLLFYRKDLLQKYQERVPATWAELSTTARKIQRAERSAGNPNMWGYVWQGRPYEGLTCDALEWIVSHGGGAIVDGAGAVTIDNPAAVAALQMAKSWIGDISPAAVLSAGEEEALAVFQQGDAVFMRNWPYAWGASNLLDSPIRNRVGIAVLPTGPNGGSGAILGGWQLSVSKFSRNKDAAIALVMHLTGKEEQRRRAIVLGLNPTISSLYQDKEVLALNPYQEILRGAVAEATARPSAVTGGKYPQVSMEFWNMVTAVLAEGKDPASSVKALDTTLRAMQTNGRW